MRIERSFGRLLGFFILLFFAVTGVLIYWQAMPEADALVASQYNPRHCLPDSAPMRGTIFDRNGVPLAWSVPDPTQPCGFRRHYADPSLAPLIGYYDPQGFGVTGLEAAYDGILSGYQQPAASGIRAGVQQLLNQAEHLRTYGQDVYLTIDERIQQQAVAKYDSGINVTCSGAYDNAPGSLVVEDPHTGEMLAWVSYPGYNNDKLVDHTDAGDGSGLTIGQEYWNQLLQDPNHPLIDRPVMDTLVPGSSFKTLTMIAALESGQYTIHSTFTQPDATAYTVNGFSITSNNLDAYTFGPQPPSFPMDLAHAYAYSDNVVFARVAVTLGAAEWLNVAQRFGISAGSNVTNVPFDIPVAHSWVYQPQEAQAWNQDQVSLAVSGFGQGNLLISPLVMTVMASAVAAGGNYYKPHLLLKSVSHGVAAASVPNVAPVLVGQAMSPQTAQGVREAMRDVVTFGSVGASGGVIAQAITSPVLEGGKTGTGQVGNNTAPQTWFVSLAPDDLSNPTGNPPRLAITVQKERDGEGACQAPVALNVYQYALPLVGYPLP